MRTRALATGRHDAHRFRGYNGRVRTPDPLGTPELTALAALIDVARLLAAPRRPYPRGSLHHVIVGVDIVGFNAPGRDDEVQLALRRALYLMLTEAFEAAAVPWHECVHEDRGDGAVVLVPAEIPAETVIGPLLTHLGAGVRRHNRLSSEIAQIRLRTAVHAGEVHRDEYGLAGRAVNDVFRLLDAPVFREMVARARAEIAVIVSDGLHDTVVRHGPGLIDPETYRPVIAVHKETRTPAWVHIPECDPVPVDTEPHVRIARPS